MDEPPILIPDMIEAAGPLVWVVKGAGALAGALVSIAYIMPKSRREAVNRLTVGFVTGFVFGGTAGAKIADMLGLLDRIHISEIALIGAAATSLSAWWGMGVLQRLAEMWSPHGMHPARPVPPKPAPPATAPPVAPVRKEDIR